MENLLRCTNSRAWSNRFYPPLTQLVIIINPSVLLRRTSWTHDKRRDYSRRCIGSPESSLPTLPASTRGRFRYLQDVSHIIKSSVSEYCHDYSVYWPRRHHFRTCPQGLSPISYASTGNKGGRRCMCYIIHDDIASVYMVI